MRDVTIGTDLEVIIRGLFPYDARPHAGKMIGNLTRYTDIPIPFARVRLTRTTDVDTERSVIAQASIELAGRLISAQVATPSAHEGIDLLADVLRHTISRLQQHWEARLGLEPATTPSQLRHEAELKHRPEFRCRPVNDRKVVRHKHFELAKCTLDDVIEDLELAGRGFHLFTDADSGRDSVVYRRNKRGYRFASVGADTDPLPVLDETGAVAAMNLAKRPFSFYANRETGRGNVIYRRYDGHYGVIIPDDR